MSNLSQYHTKQLMEFLRRARACGGSYWRDDLDITFTVDELKAELATREHIPSKAERKAIRQAQAKNQ